ncbi:MAG TPA: polysaccharide deacetylase family protein [Lysobacter sp.]|nr:polysaccharide deacetylase family protein [Lysobacter sp.]
MNLVVPHRPPRHPYAWLPALLLSQLAVVAIWWRYGAGWGVPAMLASHVPFWWATLAPNCALFSPVLRRLPTQDKLVWLTIDDGPSEDTAAILDLLDAHGAKATFFVVGARAQAHPERVRAILERGHDIGNHSHRHPSAWFWALPPRRMRAEIAQAQATLTAIAGRAPRWFRAVAGHTNPFVAAALREHGLARVAWSARGYDAVLSDPDRTVARIERDLAPGAIVLLHEGSGHGRNVEMLARLLQRLDALGYRTVLPR